MLASITRSVRFWKWYSLKAPTYLRPEEVALLQQKFRSSQQYAEKINYLTQLQNKNKLHGFYLNKSLPHLSEQELFFLMISNITYNLSRVGQSSVIAKVHSVYFKCLLYKEFGWLNVVEQYVIILSFNQQVSELTPKEISFCLGVIHDFQIAAKTIDFYRLEYALMKFEGQPESAYEMLLINGYLSQMGRKLKKVLSPQSLKNWTLNNQNWDFRSIYFVFLLSQFLELQLKEELKGKLDELMKIATKEFTIDQFETNYLVFLLKYYPEYATKLKILHFTPKGYISYLQYFIEHPEQTILKHKTPPSVLELTYVETFIKIIQKRIELQLDTPLSIAKLLPEYFVSSLNPVKAYLAYLKQQKLVTTELQYLIQKQIKSKLQLSEFDPQKLQQLQLDSIITMMYKLAKMKICSVDFWRMAVRWFQTLFAYSSKHPVIQQDNVNYLQLLYLVINKNFKQSTRDMIYNKIGELLQNDRHWSPKQLMQLSTILARSKIGEHKIWLLIQQRLFKEIQRNEARKKMHEKDKSQILQEILIRIALNFNTMGKGSFHFWNALNETLSNKLKKEILEKVRRPTSQAHIYLKVAS